jgi:hypothetical protein
MWLANKGLNIVPGFKGTPYSRKDFVTETQNVPTTYGLPGKYIYIHDVVPIKTVPVNYFTDKGITLKQSIITSNDLRLATMQNCTGINEIIPLNSASDYSDELSHFYVLSNNLEPKDVTLAISFTGVKSLDLIRAFILDDIVTYQESYYNVSRLVPFSSLTDISENVVISQYVHTTTDNLYINRQTNNSYLYKRIALADLEVDYRQGNFNTIEDTGKLFNRELYFTGKGFVVSDNYVFIAKRDV